MNKEITIENQKYKVIEDYKNGFSLENVKEKWTDYFDTFDYIVGDYAYDKLRLKGFCNTHNKNFKPINDQDNIKKYIKEDCAYECRYFILEKIEKKI